MTRRRPSPDERAATWLSLLQAAKRYHRQDGDRGMSTLIAKDAGVTKASVSEWKNGHSHPSDATVRRLAGLYGVSASELVGYPPVPGAYGKPDEILNRAADITELIVSELLPNGSSEEFLVVMRRANELLIQGKGDAEVRGQLLLEVSRRKKAQN